MYDSHAHLDLEFHGHLKEQLEAARKVGVSEWFVPGYSLAEPSGESELQSVLQDGFWASRVRRGVGLHPWCLRSGEVWGAQDWEQIRVALAERIGAVRAVAVGETGFDRAAPQLAPIGVQEQAFSVCLQLANEYQLPLVLHCVRAEGDLRRALQGQRLPPRPGVVHAFNGSREFAEWLISIGFRLGIGPLLLRQVAERRETRLVECVRSLPLEALLLETDSTGPARPLSLLPEVATVVAELRGESPELVAQRTAATARALYGGA